MARHERGRREAGRLVRRVLAPATIALLLVSGSTLAHDLFLKLDTYFLEPEAPASVALLNGTFARSLNTIARDRMRDVTIVGPEDRVAHPGPDHWRDEGDTSWLDFETGAPGTYMVGVSTRARAIELSADEFNEYLEHDGVLDVLERRRRSGELDRPATERYSKHVKAVFQVGSRRSGAYTNRLGYPVELVPLQNPYSLRAGDALDVLFLKNGAPVAGHLIYAGHEDDVAGSDGSERSEAVQKRTDEFGIARIRLDRPGRWYVRLIHMTESQEAEFDYESNWATLTFEVR